jgi:hypothetical protein
MITDYQITIRGDLMRGIFLAGALFLLAGCATPTIVSPEDMAELEKPLICEAKEQCSLYWRRSLFYVNKNSPFKIQTVNDDLIQTYSPTGGSPLIGFNISKEPLENESTRIWVKIFCDNMFGCVPEVPGEMVKLKRYVRTGL